MTDHDIDRSLIDAAREGLGPSDADRARLRRAVNVAIAGGAAIGTAAASSGASAAAKGALGGWALTKTILIGASAVVIAVGATYGAMRMSEDAEERVAVSAAPEHRDARDHVHASPRARRAIDPEPAAIEPPNPIASADEVATRAAIDVAPRASTNDVHAPRPASAGSHAAIAPERGEERASASAPSAQPPTAPLEGASPVEPAPSVPELAAHEAATTDATPPSLALGTPSMEEALAAETALLRDAHRALRAHDPARALELLDQHAARFPNGVLSEERSATHVLALCHAGRTEEARTEAARFLAAHARSMHAARVRASRCAVSSQ